MYYSIECLTAEDILNIKNPIDLFKTKDYKDILKRLNVLWHPDKNLDPLSSSVMAHINFLVTKAEKNEWGNILTFTDYKTGKEFNFKYKKKVPIEIGDMFIGQKTVLFNILKENSDLFIQGINSIQNIKFQTKILEENFKRFVPSQVKQFETDTHLILSCYKGPDQICLSDLVEMNFNFQPGHIHWILTGLYNFILFMEKTQNKMFGGLNLDTIFLNTKMRGIHVLGGWWFSKNLNKKLQALPEWIIQYINPSILKDKKAVTQIDQIALKIIAIKLLGDKTGVGSKLISIKENLNLIKFLRENVSKNTIEDYRNWLKVSKDFPILDIEINFNDVYNT